MFSREESKKIRQDFWTSFGKEYPQRWILYDTKIREIQLKFTFNRKLAQVSLDVIDNDDLIRAYYFEKLESLQKILLSEYTPDAVYTLNYELPEGKTISRIYVQMDNVSIHNKNQWSEVKEFLAKNMFTLQEFFQDFREYLKA